MDGILMQISEYGSSILMNKLNFMYNCECVVIEKLEYLYISYYGIFFEVD